MIRDLPEFPWHRLAAPRRLAERHPGGIVDLAMGTPVDDTPDVVHEALACAANAPGHPPVEATPRLREAAADWLRRRFGVAADPDAVLPTLGTKEFIAWLPAMLGAGPGDVVGVPRLGFPTFRVGALLAGATPVPFADPRELAGARMVWLNSPSNPDGVVLSAAVLRAIVDWARAHGVLVVNDECYADFGWDGDPVSILHPSVCGDSHDGLLAVRSLSKRSNMTGYRAGLVTGDRRVVAELTAVRRQAGMAVPAPVAAAMAAALGDETHVVAQRVRYARRATVLRSALTEAGFRIDGSTAGLFLWATRDEPCMRTVEHLAALGILVSPGDMYGAPGARHVRVALTASDARVGAAAARLAARSESVPVLAAVER
ncbi:succinyldiaminopimelate transaminase [Actinokineospora sp. UTMC 2448]|uniref:succinyldiaminopimelate transaminase n=1 Tax=Actinokineospora sp. UTMC 2448 TaxID=2268449 RepID=UPI002208592D|nr:LL-diaminopimelate aminotransferase [Actinokineospora sp. UTMC 2448]